MNNLLKIVAVTDIPSVIESVPADLAKIHDVCKELETLCRAENGIGIAATQAGIPWNVFLIRFDNEYRYFVECKYQPIGNRRIMTTEGCLSLRKSNGQIRMFRVDRYEKVRITGKQLIEKDGVLQLQEIKKNVSGQYSPVWQHEIDHGNLILISDHGVEVNP